MSITGIPQTQIAPTQDRQAGATTPRRVDDQVRNSGGFSALAAQNLASGNGNGNAAQGASRTGAQPLNATGRGRIVNIVV
jgi:hypothetical protein